MKIATKEIAAYMKAPAARHQAVLIYGPDEGLIRERAKTIAAQVVENVSDPFLVAELTEEQLKAAPTRLFEELSALSLIGGKRLVMVRGAGDKLTDLVKEALPLLNPQVFLILESDDLSARSSLRMLADKESVIASLPCYRDEGRNLEALIRQTLGAVGLQIDADAASFLAHNLGNDRKVTLSELEKLALFMGDEKRVTLDHVRKVVGNNTDMTMDDLCYVVLLGEIKSLQFLQERLKQEGVNAVAILRSLSRHVNRLYQLTQQVAEGNNLDEAIASLRPQVFFRQVPLLKRAAMAWRPARLKHAQNLLLKAERELKTHYALQDQLLGNYLLRLARAA